MATNKKSFLLYCDLIHTVKHLPNETAGELFKHILSYVNDENPVSDNLILNISFEPIKQQLKRDLQKYEELRKRNSNNGKKGGRPKTEVNPKNPVGIEERKQNFVNKVYENTEYPEEMLKTFVNYWTEKNPKGVKMRFEMEKVFDVKRRLVTWQSKSKDFKQDKTTFKDRILNG